MAMFIRRKNIYCQICTNRLPKYKAKYCDDKCSKLGRQDTTLKRRHKLSLDEYQNKSKIQNDVCAICEQSCSSGWRLAVDHCHATGKIRGLLCKRCNQLLGQFNDDVSLFEKAIAYLTNYKNVC